VLPHSDVLLESKSIEAAVVEKGQS
jgi:hypothetical protein